MLALTSPKSGFFYALITFYAFGTLRVQLLHFVCTSHALYALVTLCMHSLHIECTRYALYAIVTICMYSLQTRIE
jgi:hypothetical protein